MNTYAKFAIAAAAVVVVAVVGINLLPRSGGDVGGAPTVSPSSTPSPSPTASPSPSEVAFPPDSDLVAGKHSMTRNGIRLSVTLPTSGWRSDGGFFFNNDFVNDAGVTPQGASFLFWDANPIGVFADPCAEKKAPPAGPSAADLASAVSTLAGAELVSGPTDVTVGGRPAKHVVLTVPEDAPCGREGREFYLWYNPPGNERYISALGATMRVWIIDVDGTIVWIDGETYKGAGPGPGQEIQHIIDSIQFE